MSAAVRLALRDLGGHRGQLIALVGAFSIAVMAYGALGSYRAALAREYPAPVEDYLIVQESQSFAEFYGSRLTPEVKRMLGDRGVEIAVPEIHSIVGTTLENAVLIKGVDLAHYQELDDFELLAGVPLRSGDRGRQALIGVSLAERLAIRPGDEISLRGRPFEVVGVFETGTYADNEAWVPLAGAQDLLGWGDDVSLFVVPNNGTLTAGQSLGPGISVVRRGELWSSFPRQWNGVLALLQRVTEAIGLAAAISLAVTLWRMAWHRRRQIAVMRTVGLDRSAVLIYLGVQGAIITLVGGAAGALAALALVRVIRLNLAGVGLRPVLTAELLASAVIWLIGLTALSVVIPAWQLGRHKIVELLTAT